VPTKRFSIKPHAVVTKSKGKACPFTSTDTPTETGGKLISYAQNSSVPYPTKKKHERDYGTCLFMHPLGHYRIIPFEIAWGLW